MTAFQVESWTWYGFAMTMVALRMIARYRNFKAISRLQIEDWSMLGIACIYTVLITTLNICIVMNTNLIDPHDIPTLTPQDIADRTFGSKMILVVEQCMCLTQWGTKACMLMLYWRLTENLTQSLLVKGAAIYVGGTFLVMEVLYFGVWCRPFHDYWQTPTDNIQCTTALHHLIVNLAFNLSSDLLIMSIPLPLFLRAHLEFKRKLLLVLPFSLGFLSIVCAILSKHLSFTQPFSAEWAFWYTREASTIVIASNMPYTWGLIRKLFNAHSFFGPNPTGTRTNNTGPTHMRVPSLNLYGGEIQELRGVPLSTTTSNAMPAGDLEMLGQSHNGSGQKQSFFKLTPWKKNGYEWRMERLPSTAGSQAPNTDREKAHGPHWTDLNNHKQAATVVSDGGSSSNSVASDSQTSLTIPASTQQRLHGNRSSYQHRRSNSGH